MAADNLYTCERFVFYLRLVVCCTGMADMQFALSHFDSFVNMRNYIYETFVVLNSLCTRKANLRCLKQVTILYGSHAL